MKSQELKNDRVFSTSAKIVVFAFMYMKCLQAKTTGTRSQCQQRPKMLALDVYTCIYMYYQLYAYIYMYVYIMWKLEQQRSYPFCCHLCD